MERVPSPVKPASVRAYSSPVREQSARRTRRLVLDAALARFTEQGYPRTTLAEIAAAAGVSVETVYKVFKNKVGLLKQLGDVVVGGDDDDVALLEREAPQRLRAETDQRVQLAMLAAGVTVQLERLGPYNEVLRTAAAVDAEAAALRDDVHLRQRRMAMSTIAGWVADRGPLRDDLPVERAAAVIWTLAGPEVHRMLRVDWSWTPDQYEAWLRDTLTATLLP
jgi:AcrR family transcriptional regulator